MGTLEASQFSPSGSWDGSTAQPLLAVPAPGTEAGQGTTESSVLAGAEEHLPKQCLAWAGHRLCPKQAVQGCPCCFGEAGEQRKGVSCHTELLGPRLKDSSQLVLWPGRDAAT